MVYAQWAARAVCLLLAIPLLTTATAADKHPAASNNAVIKLATTARPMSASEQADIRAMEAETKPNASHVLDMTNPLHYRFVMAALARAGETPAKSPEFFRRLKTASLKLKANAKPAHAMLAAANGPAPNNLNFISDFSVDGNASKFQATGLSSVVGGTNATLITVEIYNVKTGTVFAVNQGRTSEYAQGTNFKVQAQGNTPAGIQDNTSLAQAVFAYVPVGGNQPVVEYYRSSDTVNPSSPCMKLPNYCVRDSNKNCLQGQYATACTNTVSNTTEIKTCWARGSQQECDYWNPIAHPTQFTFPLQGSVSFPNNTVVSPLTGYVNIALQNPLNGGGCNVYFQQLGTLDPKYWSLSGTTVSWNYPAAAFDNAGTCINYYDGTSTILWMSGSIFLQGAPNAPPPYGGINFTSDRNQIGIPGVSIIPGIYIRQGCFAAGTRVLQADGTTRKIEDFAASDQETVLSGDGTRMTVSGITKGTEPLKTMVRIRSANGHELLLTETHPVITAGGIPVMAKNLTVGQKVTTREGDAALVSVTREAYPGKVYNLRLGNPTTTDEKGASMYAEGILTGDSRMQDYYVRLDHEKLARDPNEVERRLPAEWLQDFRNHKK